MRVTVFGLGEAGSLIASDLVEEGVQVHGYDPASVPTPQGVIRHDRPDTCVEASTMVLAITAAADSRTALHQAIDSIEPGAIYADLSTATPDLEIELGTTAAEAGLRFADVALMAPVPGKGLRTPVLTSGPAAGDYATFLAVHGTTAQVVSGNPGDASARKLLRSIVTKGLTSLLIESLLAAEAHGSIEWVWAHLVDTLTGADESLLLRLLEGTPPHVDRRIEEMESVAGFLESLRVEPTMTRGTIRSLRSVKLGGMPNVP